MAECVGVRATVAVLSAGILLLAGLSPGCAAEQATTGGAKDAATVPHWPVFRGDLGLSGVSTSSLPEKLRRVWVFRARDEILSTPVVADGLVVIGSYDGTVYALDVDTGKPRWRKETESAFEAPPLLMNGTVYIGSLDGELLALDAGSGEQRWSYKTDGKITGSVSWFDPPGEAGPRLYLGCYDNRLHCIDAGTGKQVWVYDTGNYINGGPALAGDAVLFGGCDAFLHRLSAVDGSSLAAIDVGSYAAGSPATAAGRAYVGTYGGLLVAVDLETQKTVWQYESEDAAAFFSSPAVNEEVVIIGGRDGCLHCVDRATGKRRWLFRTQGDVDSSPVITADGKVVVGSADGRLYVVSLADGGLLWSYEIGAAVLGSPAVTGGMILVGAEDGRLYAFAQGGEEPSAR